MSDVASYRSISEGAEQLYRTCVDSGQRTQGGYIRDIGKQDFVVVSHILCQGRSIDPEDISPLYRTHLMPDTT